MLLSDFDFHLPKELIAQSPSEKRDHSKILIQNSSRPDHYILPFYDIISLLSPGDLMIFNDTKVINAQLNVQKNNKAININLNRKVFYQTESNDKNRWLAFAKPSKRIEVGDEFIFDEHKFIVTNKMSFGQIEVEFFLKDGLLFFDFLRQYGTVPLPPYIKSSRKDDALRYQTVFAKKEGSVASSTAGLHFTNELLEKIKNLGVEIDFVTLNIGAGTFLPVKTENIEDHYMHKEYCEVSETTAQKINSAKKDGRRVIAVGTTVMRTLESFAVDVGEVTFGSKETQIFINPGYNFKIVDALITNFHLPKSTLFMLLSAFIGLKEAHQAYKYAIEHKMRFFSYGDSMFCTKKI